MNWYELKSLCIDHVATEIARNRLTPDHNKLTFEERFASWKQKAKEAEPEAVERINAMSNTALLDLISEVVGTRENI